jgi:hypothetical protein
MMLLVFLVLAIRFANERVQDRRHLVEHLMLRQHSFATKQFAGLRVHVLNTPPLDRDILPQAQYLLFHVAALLRLLRALLRAATDHQNLCESILTL